MSTDTVRDELRELARGARSDRVERLFSFSPFDYQAAILDDENEDVVTTCGRQVGKTETGGALGADAFVCSDGYDVMIAAKWQETADEMLRRAKGHLANAGFGEDHPEIETWNKREVESVTGGRLYSKTLKVADGEAGDNQRGKLPRVVIIDESAIVDGAAVEKVIRPMFLTHGDDHELYLFSTPRGKQGFHFEKHENDEEWSAHHVPSHANPLIDDDYLEAERESVDELTWRQEYLGEFIDLGEVYITREAYDACRAEATSSDQRYLGVDVARQGSDRTVYLPIDADGVVIEDATVAESISDVPGIVSRIETLHAEHGFRAVAIDENAVGGGVVDYSSMGLGDVITPVPFTTQRKSQMYRKLKADLERQDLVVPASTSEHSERLRDETVNLQYDYTANGTLKVHHAPGGRDDYADAFALANWVRSNPGPTVTRRRSGSRPAKSNLR